MTKLFTYFPIFLLISLFASEKLSSQYCIPETNCTEGDGVVEFGLGPFYNSSGCGADEGTPGYSDFTALEGLIIAPGVAYDGLFRSDFGSQQFSIWIDIDNSSSFESSELILTDHPVGEDIEITEIVIPSTFPLGIYRLRVQSSYFAQSSLDACDVNSTFGETEDYTVTITDPPSCIHVSALSADAIASDEATISWSDGGTAAVWDVEYGPQGFSPTGNPSPGFDNTTNPTLITGLTPVSTYDVYVRADCGEDNVSDVSLWSGPFTFITACGAVVPDYLEDMNDGVLECWSFFADGDLSTGPIDVGFSNWFNGGFANIPNVWSGCQTVSLFGSGANNWMISPDFDLSGGDFQTEFDLSINGGGFGSEAVLDEDDEFFFLITTDAGITWDTLGLWNQDNLPSPLGDHMIYPLTDFTDSTVRFAFYATNGTVEGSFYQNFVDNFRVQSIGSPLQVSIDMVVEPDCFDFGNPLADVIVSVSGGEAPYSFLWSNGVTTEDLLDSEPGTVTLTVTDGAGSEYVSDEIIVPGTPVLTINAIITNESSPGAADGMIEITDITGGQEPYFFSWNHGATTQTIDGLIDAYWCVQVSDGNNCSTDTCLEVLETPLSLNDQDFLTRLSIFPNPVQDDHLNVVLETPNSTNIDIAIIDALGRYVWQERYMERTIIQDRIDFSQALSGLYLLRITDLDSGATITRAISK